MDNPVQILGADGNPMPARPGKASMLSGASNTPYDAANLYGAHVEDWMPYLWSPDGEINMYHDRITARARDLIRNDGWATAAVMRTVDNVVGPDFRPIAKPDYRALQSITGNKKYDHVWADEFGQHAEANWRAWAHDSGFYCDSERALTFPQMMQLAFRHQLIDGERRKPQRGNDCWRLMAAGRAGNADLLATHRAGRGRVADVRRLRFELRDHRHGSCVGVGGNCRPSVRRSGVVKCVNT